jgi:hypothetical protein
LVTWVVEPLEGVDVRAKGRRELGLVQLDRHTRVHVDGSVICGSVAFPVPVLDRYGPPGGWVETVVDGPELQAESAREPAVSIASRASRFVRMADIGLLGWVMEGDRSGDARNVGSQDRARRTEPAGQGSQDRARRTGQTADGHGDRARGRNAVGNGIPGRLEAKDPP